MLNEIVEFEEYTAPLSEDMSRRLKYRHLVNKASGIERAMTIIARDFINTRFDKWFSDAPDASVDRIELTKDIIRAWCGYPHKKASDGFKDEASKNEYNEYYSKIENYYSTYIIYMTLSRCSVLQKECTALKGFLNENGGRVSLQDVRNAMDAMNLKQPKDYKEKEKQKAVTCFEKLKEYAVQSMLDRERTYNGKLFISSIAVESENANNFKRTTFDDIIASAIDNGSLRNTFIIAADKKLTDDIIKSTPKNPNKPLSENTYDTERVDKLIALFMKNRTNKDAQYIHINLDDYYNWCIAEITKPEEVFGPIRYGEEELFIRYFKNDDGSGKKVNVQKIGLAESFLKDRGNRLLLIDESEVTSDGSLDEKKLLDTVRLKLAEEVTPERLVVYRDIGSGYRMQVESMEVKDTGSK